jgi:hypothetical protein
MLSSSTPQSEAQKHRVTNAEEAKALLDLALTSLDALEPIIAEETALLKEGMTREALRLSIEKAQAAGAYTRTLEALKGNAIAIGRFAPDELALLRRRHDTFSELLAYNMTVLTTVRSVSEGIMREISTEVGAKANPSGYDTSGRSPQRNVSQSSSPIAISKAV